MIGRIISHYKILEKLGEGGMGVVYKAEDTKLKREVALKFLPANALHGKEDKERFTREAQAAAALNHANIAHIYAIEEFDGQMFIAMEYIEGQSLEKMITVPLPLDNAIDIATQIAAGLQAAHEKGVIHRDIKSANIMVADKGVVKIMDFGLAKLANRSRMTQLGTTLGTVAYMSPEQAGGEETDHRADIWSLGVVLYEMISGQQPFRGDYDQAIIYSILNKELEPLTAMRTDVPMELERVVEKAMAKSPDERFQHIDEMLVDLQVLQKKLGNLNGVTMTRARAARRPTLIHRTLPWRIFSCLATIIAVIALLWIWRINKDSDKHIVRFSINLEQGRTLVESGPSLALSRDGTKLVYAAQQGDTSHLFLHLFDAFDSNQIPGTEGALAPFFSPDGNWVGFFADGKLKKVSLRGGKPQTLCDANFVGASWDQNGQIIFSEDYPDAGLWRIAENGGDPEALTGKDEQFKTGVLRFEWPQILPGGEAILVTDRITASSGDMEVLAILPEVGERRILIEKCIYARYIPTGFLVYVREADLLAVPFDSRSLKITGSPIPVLEGVRSANGGAHYDFSESGSLAYIPGGVETWERDLVWVNHKGEIERLPLPPGHYSETRLSPDGKRIVFLLSLSGKTSIWICDIERGTLRRITDDEGEDTWPVWTPDGKRIVFNSTLYGGSAFNLYSKPADGSDQAERLTESDYHHEPQSWTEGGNVLAFTEVSHPQTGMDIWILRFDGDRKVLPLLKTKFNETHPSFSPDGRWLAYASDESGRYEVYVRPYPALGEIMQISIDGGWEPVWSADGKELFYRNVRGNRMMAASFHTDPKLHIGRPRLVFEGEYIAGKTYGRTYDISPDGQRFLMHMRVEQQSAPTSINIVLNWFEELKRLAAAGK